MRLVFFINYLNIHQVYLIDEFYHLLGEDFRFVATLPRREDQLKGGDDYSNRCYTILAGECEMAHVQALQLARESDVCVFGACSQEYALERAKSYPDGLSFEVGERWLKRGLINVLSPALRSWYNNYIRYYRHRPFYKLCCSAFAAHDDRMLHVYKGRHFKWGYFTQVHEYEEPSRPQSSVQKPLTIMWCSRFLKLKHPELVIQLAAMLKRNGYEVQTDMYGSGPEQEVTMLLCRQMDVNDVVSFKGSAPNEVILQAMRQHDIFLFTSDHNEGWGAVLNEAMSNRCAVVASDAIGSAPFLIRDGKNGLLFKSGQVNSLYEKVVRLIMNPEERRQLAERGYQDMLRVWSPRNAAKNLLQLIDDLKAGRDTSITNGPCSKAE